MSPRMNVYSVHVGNSAVRLVVVAASIREVFNALCKSGYMTDVRSLTLIERVNAIQERKAK